MMVLSLCAMVITVQEENSALYQTFMSHTASSLLPDGGLHQVVGLQVHRRRRLVQHEHLQG